MSCIRSSSLTIFDEVLYPPKRVSASFIASCAEFTLPSIVSRDVRTFHALELMSRPVKASMAASVKGSSESSWATADEAIETIVRKGSGLRFGKRRQHHLKLSHYTLEHLSIGLAVSLISSCGRRLADIETVTCARI